MKTETIVALASPPGQGAVGLIRISGPESLAIGEGLFRPFPKKLRPRYQYLAKCVDQKEEVIDEVLFTYFKGPSSFTGEDVVEVACHGGMVVAQWLLRRINELGARPAEPGEFSQRAFLNGKLDLTQAEAIMDLISAKTELAVKAAGQQLAGNLGNAIEQLRLELIEVTAHVEAYIDFPDEDIDPESAGQIRKRITDQLATIDSLLATADRGRILREGIRTVICGAPNAGKSSLLNCFAGFDRAIVSDTAGTTRDTIEETINLQGIPLTIVDTAGIRDSQDQIEKMGIERSREAMGQAELVLLMIDMTQPKEAIKAIETPLEIPLVEILNKADLPPHPDWENYTGDAVALSCETGRGIQVLEKTLVSRLSGEGIHLDRSEMVAINGRHQHCLQQAKAFLESSIEQLDQSASPEFISFEIRESLESIGAVVGKTDIEEILGSIFSAFCIGK